MRYLILALFLTGCTTSPVSSRVISDADAGYNQDAYDACVDNSEDSDCEGIEL